MNASIAVRLYEELNDCLPREKRKADLHLSVADDMPVGRLLDELGVPAGKVDMIRVNGESVDLRHRLRDGDRISVFPVFESFDISDQVRVREHPLRAPRFVLDAHLGKLAAYMRMLGFDTLYKNDFKDHMLMALSRNKGRILLSKDRTLVHKSGLTRVYEVKAVRPRAQLSEVLERFDLYGLVRPFQRCMECNALLETVRRDEVAGRVPPQVWQEYQVFRVCPDCHKVYWSGSHYRRMREFIQSLLAQRRNESLKVRGGGFDGADGVNQ